MTIWPLKMISLIWRFNMTYKKHLFEEIIFRQKELRKAIDELIDVRIELLLNCISKSFQYNHRMFKSSKKRWKRKKKKCHKLICFQTKISNYFSKVNKFTIIYIYFHFTSKIFLQPSQPLGKCYFSSTNVFVTNSFYILNWWRKREVGRKMEGKHI